MKIKVKVIGRYKDIIQQSEIEFDAKTGDSIRQVIDRISERYPVIGKDKKFLMVSKNGVYASFDTIIYENDVITIAPPVVSGG